MSNIIPALQVNEIENDGERDVYEALANNAPSDWFIRYNYIFTWKNGNYYQDGEIDFIILIPKIGLLVLEVKGSHGYDCLDGQWCRVDKHLKRTKTKNPFGQAMGNKHTLVSQLCKKVYKVGKDEFPGNYGYAVVYPRAMFEGALPDACEPSLIVANRDMPRLVSRLEAILKKDSANPTRSIFEKEFFNQAKKYLSDQTTLVPVLSPEIADDNKTITHVTQDQYRILKSLLDHQRLHVEGGAGSGKTLLAKWSSEHKASNGDNVLFTCYNRNLAAWLKRDLDSTSNIRVSSFFALARDVIIKAGIPFNPPSDPSENKRFWRDQVPNMMCEALEHSNNSEIKQSFDCIIVDEGQDFSSDWWFPLMLLHKDPDNGLLQVFSDEDQRAIYGTDNSFPLDLFKIPLTFNCRNTRSITTFSSKLIDRQPLFFERSPKGLPPSDCGPLPDARSRASEVKSIFNELCKQGFTTSQIAILSPFKKENNDSSLKYLKKIRNLPIVNEDSGIQSWQNGKGIWGSTIKSFKGLEADCIILTDISKNHLHPRRIADFYVGCTRAKNILKIVVSDHETQSFIKNQSANT